MVDIPRKSAARQRRIRRAIYGAVAVLVLGGITLGVSKLKPAAPSVERATVWIDTVKRGPMLRQVRGSGTLVPEEISWIPASTEGRVERIVLRPGAAVGPDSVILELSNAELQQSALEAELQLKGAGAAYQNRRVELETQLLNQQAQFATIEADYHQARLQAEADEQLAKQGLTSDLTLKISKSKADELGTRIGLERKRLGIAEAAVKSQLAVQQAEIDRVRTLFSLRKSQLAHLKVRAGSAGVLQQVPVEVGQRVAPGTNLARVANPGRLKAELKIAETQAKDIQIGQVSEIDTRNGVIRGHVSRIDPAAESGTVAVDVALDGELPRGARPDLTVDGTIELERLDNVIYVGRPAFGQEQSTISLFRLDASSSDAVRAKVALGRSSVNTIEIKEGLQPGDQVILSDMSAWDQFDRVRLR
ncbi:MAG: HlyD family efflux transporter periplasmic adaptor subunit [Acidobacteria bacterium]|nr:HlyD family efflux transporter periplasmic adaptor subunit [Acidobacteriota bacterium]